MTFILLFAVATWAGAQNALAGGGSFLTLPTLMFTGMDALAANITSCAALFPAQVATGWTGRKLAKGANGLSLRTLFVISIVGGAVGAAVLLGTPRGLLRASRAMARALCDGGLRLGQFLSQARRNA